MLSVHRERVAQNLEGALHFGQHAPGYHFEVEGIQHVLHQDCELVAAQAGGRVLGAQAGAQTVGQCDQEHVAGGVAEGGVDGFEVIEVEVQDAAAFTAAGPAHQREGDAVLEQRAVGQAGKHVVHGVVLQPGFDLLALADVAKGEDSTSPLSGDQQRRDMHGHVDELAVPGHANGFQGGAPIIIDGLVPAWRAREGGSRAR